MSLSLLLLYTRTNTHHIKADLARYLGVSRAGVTQALKKLNHQQYETFNT